MMMYFRDLDPHALLVQECDYDFCHKTLTVHGFVNQVRWHWAKGQEGHAVFPGVVCRNCLQQWRVEFAVEPAPTRGDVAASESVFSELGRQAAAKLVNL